MFASLFFIVRLACAWLLLYIAAAIVVHETLFRHAGGEGLIVSGGFLLAAIIITGAFSHVHRVRLIAGKVTSAALARRHRRQVEIPLEAGVAFDLVEAAMRELPGVRAVESARDSLQSRVRMVRVNPYPGESVNAPWLTNLHSLRNQVSMTVTPSDGGEAGSVMLICEPERAAWTDWFLVDYGSNLENAEALARAIARRVAEKRRLEQVDARQSATEKELTVAKLSLLHAQVEPHFLYNTLASAQILTRTDPGLADTMLGNLIVYLRHSLPRTDDAMSSLGEELERALAYLDILKIRMGARLRCQVDVPARLRAQPMPPMMLQTLVENAIKHGLEPQSGGGTIWILARTSDSVAGEPTLSVTVADDGRGLWAGAGAGAGSGAADSGAAHSAAGNAAGSAPSSGTGIGLANLRERLRLAYGAAASFQIVANFPSGVASTITLPARLP